MTPALRAELTALCDRLTAAIAARSTPAVLAAAALPITNLLHASGVKPDDFTGADSRLLAVVSVALLVMPHTRPAVGPDTLGAGVMRELGMVPDVVADRPVPTNPAGHSPRPNPTR